MLFSKCIKEPNYIDLYMELVDAFFTKFKSDPEKKALNFRKLFLSRCQAKLQAQENDLLMLSPQKEGDEEVILNKKERIFGSVKLIAELFVRGTIPDTFVKNCIDKLLKMSMEENVENAIHLLLGIGKKLYQYFAYEAKLTTLKRKPRLIVNVMTKELFDDYIDKLIALNQEGKLSSRVKFLVQDVITARDKEWSNAFDQFPVVKPQGKAKEDIVAYRKKTKSIEKKEGEEEKKAVVPPQVLPTPEQNVKIDEQEKRRNMTNVKNVFGKNLEKYQKSSLDQKYRVCLLS